MKRREFLSYCSSLASQMALTTIWVKGLTIPSAFGDSVAIDSLKQLLDPAEAMVLVPRDSNFAKYQTAFNMRTLVTPLVRVICSTPNAIAKTVKWAQDNRVPLAIRGGGHSYEGLSQSTGIVIDTRPMAEIAVAGDATSVTVGAGAALGNIYQAVGARGVVLAAGSCPTVGIAGHSTGGGYGLLARPFGLACDNILGFEIVTADGRILNANERDNSDLYWACRGAGSGSFGVITRLQFRTHQVGKVYTFGITWALSAEAALPIIREWQHWAPEAPHGINALLRVRKEANGQITVRCFGQSVGTEAALRTELARLIAIHKPTRQSVDRRTWLAAVQHYAGKETKYPSVYMKGKSDYLKQVMSDQGIRAFLTGLPKGKITALFDSYGGTIRQLRDSDTAFAHREQTVCSIQYYSEWDSAGDSGANLATMRTFYNSLRPYMSGSAYFNYCDLDLNNWAEAYWGRNLGRLIQIKNAVDPTDFFKHAQSIPLKRA